MFEEKRFQGGFPYVLILPLYEPLELCPIWLNIFFEYPYDYIAEVVLARTDFLSFKLL